MLKVGIIGASGYTGIELARILSNHPEVELTVATSRQYAGKPLSEVFPSLRKRVDLICENLGTEELIERADFFFAAVPHKTAMDIVPPLLSAGKKVVDLSADFRIRDANVYEQWYQTHCCAELINEAVYGLPELYRDQVRKAAPLLREKLIDPATLIIDSKSGTSGAGRSASVGTLFCEVTDGFRAYKVGGSHRHIPEIEQELSVLAEEKVTVSFTPHLLPISRGILSTMYASMNSTVSEQDIQQIYEQTYGEEPFVRVCPPGTFPATQYVRGSNCCDIGIKVDHRTGRIIVLTAIDNIAKGASGQAVQNMNLMNGFAETSALLGAPFFP